MDVAERQGFIKSEAALTYRLAVDAEVQKEADGYPTTQYDTSAVAAAQATYEAKVDAINAATTHDDLDAI